MSKESVYFKIENLNDKHDMKQVKKQLDKIGGVISISVNTTSHKVAVDFDNTAASQSQIEGSLEKLGFKFKTVGNEDHIM